MKHLLGFKYGCDPWKNCAVDEQSRFCYFIFIILIPTSTLDICFFPPSVYKKYNLRVTDSASLPACVLVQWVSGLPEACIGAHGYPRLWRPRFTSHPLWMILQRRCQKKLWPGGGKCTFSLTMKDETAAHSEGVFIQSIFGDVWSNIWKRIDLFCSFGLVRIMAFKVKWQTIKPPWLNIIVTCITAATRSFFMLQKVVALMEVDVKEALHWFYTRSSDYLSRVPPLLV